MLYSPPIRSARLTVNPHQIVASDNDSISTQQIMIQYISYSLDQRTRPDNLPLNATRSDVDQKSRTFVHDFHPSTRLGHLHSHLGSSNSRSSFDYLPHDGAVYANIGLHMVREQNTLLLYIEFQNRAVELCPPFELDGTPILLILPETV